MGILHILRRTHLFNGLKFGMLMYPDHFQIWLDFGHSLLIFYIVAQVWFSEMGQISGFCAFSGERMEGILWNLACWFFLNTFRTDKILVIICWFPLLWQRWLCETGHIMGFLCIHRKKRMHGRNGLKLDMLMYPDHIQNWFWSQSVDFLNFCCVFNSQFPFIFLLFNQIDSKEKCFSWFQSLYLYGFIEIPNIAFSPIQFLLSSSHYENITHS